MNENETWIRLCGLIAAVLCVLIVSVAGCTSNRQYQTRMLIENAHINPIEARCAIDGDSLTSGACLLRATK